MSHWDYHQGCRCPWWCYEYLRLDIRRVRGKVIFPGTQRSLRNVLFRDHCLQSCGFDQEGDHQRGLQLFLLALDFVNPSNLSYFPPLSFFLQYVQIWLQMSLFLTCI